MPWPISQRGEDLENDAKQRQAADMLNLERLRLAQEKSAKKIAAKQNNA